MKPPPGSGGNSLPPHKINAGGGDENGDEDEEYKPGENEEVQTDNEKPGNTQKWEKLHLTTNPEPYQSGHWGQKPHKNTEATHAIHHTIHVVEMNEVVAEVLRDERSHKQTVYI